MQIRQLAAVWFGLHAPVGRRVYALTGFSLMALKYSGDVLLVGAARGVWWTPLDYLSPLLHTRQQLVGDDPVVWLLPAMIVWTLPFVWIGASMTLRRAMDAGFAPQTGLAFFVPVVNYLWILALCVIDRRPAGPVLEVREQHSGAQRLPILRAAWPAALLGVTIVVLSVFGFKSYSGTLFVGAPVAMGFVAGLRAGREGFARGVLAAQLALVITGGTLLLFALEGVICLAMAWPLAAILALIGVLLGNPVGRQHRLQPTQIALLLMTLPALLALESTAPDPPPRTVVSRIEIVAPPSVVWEHVVGFGELPKPSRVVFQLGIAHPLRARIDGTGVGAVRYCEFSTGPFVEPITVWDEPRRLGFDVVAQPPPMHETSPYQVVHAPHLLDGLVSERGEFRLVALPGGRTRLEGTTWYRVHMAPQPYWGAISDALIHAIHARVLEHVKQLSEAANG